MTDERTASHPPPRLAVAALVLLCAGWGVSILGDGFELHRSAMAMPLIVAGALCGLVPAWRERRSMRIPVLLAGGVAMLYFAVRALLSPVWDLGRHDLHLVALAWLTIATVASCAVTPRRAAVVVGALVLVFVGHLVLSLYQQFVDPEFAFLRLPRRSNGGVSGLFWHWNNLAATLAIMLPLFLGVGLTARRGWMRLLFVSLVLVGVGLAYLTKSRAGIAAVVIGLAGVGVLLLLRRTGSWSWSARLAAWTGLGLAGLAAAVVLFAVVSRVSEERGQGPDFGAAIGKSTRLALAGMAFDQWLEKPLTGQGSQSFHYLVVEHWDAEVLPSWLGHPETVHNEYLQVLADYGLIGLVLVLAFVLVSLACLLVPPRAEEPDHEWWLRGLQFGAAGGLLGAMAHAAVDFQIHLLPVALLAGVALGLLAHERGTAKQWTRALHAAAVIVAAVLAVVSVGAESLATGPWLRWEIRTVKSGGNLEVAQLADLKALIKSSPHYVAASSYGRMSSDYYRQNPAERKEWLEEAHWGLGIAYQRNPNDQATIRIYADVLDLLGRHEEAAPVHRRALEMAGARENKYGARGGLSLHLYERGQALWFKRKPQEALGCFLWAKDYLEASRARGFKFGGGQEYAERKRLLESRITLLQTAGIKPQFPGDVPPPPPDQKK